MDLCCFSGLGRNLWASIKEISAQRAWKFDDKRIEQENTEGREEAMETPVLRKVQGKMAEVLRRESWPGPEKGKS